MIYGHLSSSGTYDFLLARPAWKTAFDWLKTVAPSTPLGIHQLQGDQIYASVQAYDPLPVEQCAFETHRRYIDLQYCISGGELIGWALPAELEPNGGYNAEKDYQLYHPCSGKTALRMTPGRFAIFFPCDGHAPKGRDGLNQSVLKLVVKIDSAVV